MVTSAHSMELAVVAVVVIVLLVIPATRICAKAGFSPWLGVVAAVPGANILLLWFLALAKWPSRGADA